MLEAESGEVRDEDAQANSELECRHEPPLKFHGSHLVDVPGQVKVIFRSKKKKEKKIEPHQRTKSDTRQIRTTSKQRVRNREQRKRDTWGQPLHKSQPRDLSQLVKRLR
jgi:hypothetical protein